jgi:hypothetical protein
LKVEEGMVEGEEVVFERGGRMNSPKLKKSLSCSLVAIVNCNMLLQRGEPLIYALTMRQKRP